MEVAFTLPLGLLVVAGISAALFIAVTVLAHQQGMFDGGGGYAGGLDGVFAICLYAILWVIPSLVALAAWAIWFRA